MGWVWRRAGATALAAATAMSGIGATARADDSKKKPGLFDFAPWKSPVTRERDAARQLEPGKLDLTPDGAEPGALRTVRLRIYADRDYRMIVLRWKQRLRAQIERINAATAPIFAVRFEIESVREWDRSHTGIGFEAILADLEALDPAREVDWVMGLVTPLTGVAASAHQIGGARMLSRHLVMRGMDDEQEILALERELALLPPDERQRLYGDRKAHKEVVMFLHEWGHTLGLLHHEAPTAIMNPSYDARQSTFSPFEKRVAALVIDRRLARPHDRDPESAALEPLLADSPGDEGSDKDRAQLLQLVRDRTRADASRAASASAAAASAEDVARFNRAVELANAKQLEPAWGELAPLAHRLAATKTAGDARFTLRVAELAAHVGALSVADALLDQVMRDDAAATKLAGEIESARHRVALPARTGGVVLIPADREPAFIAAFYETLQLAADDPAVARARIGQLATEFPEAPGIDVLACEVEQRAKKRSLATKRCEAALAKFDGATRALTLLGLLAAEAGRDAVAEKHLRRAILLDPSDPSAWRILSQLYRATHARRQLEELANQHQALLSSPLPE